MATYEPQVVSHWAAGVGALLSDATYVVVVWKNNQPYTLAAIDPKNAEFGSDGFGPDQFRIQWLWTRWIWEPMD